MWWDFPGLVEEDQVLQRWQKLLRVEILEAEFCWPDERVPRMCWQSDIPRPNGYSASSVSVSRIWLSEILQWTWLLGLFKSEQRIMQAKYGWKDNLPSQIWCHSLPRLPLQRLEWLGQGSRTRKVRTPDWGITEEAEILPAPGLQEMCNSWGSPHQM